MEILLILFIEDIRIYIVPETIKWHPANLFAILQVS
jgi:hypothetical protein